MSNIGIEHLEDRVRKLEKEVQKSSEAETKAIIEYVFRNGYNDGRVSPSPIDENLDSLETNPTPIRIGKLTTNKNPLLPKTSIIVTYVDVKETSSYNSGDFFTSKNVSEEYECVTSIDLSVDDIVMELAKNVSVNISPW